MTQDLNKRISSIQYNLLNLPQNITYSTGSTIAYTYDAAGKKLLYLLLKEMGKTDKEVCDIMGLSDAGLRSIRNRTKPL